MRRRRGKPSLPVLQAALAAVMEGGTPDVSGDETLGTIAVRDPYEERDYLSGKTGLPSIRAKIVNLRDDPLGRLHARGQIDECQYAAGRRWQRDYHDAELANLKAIDFTRDVVDGGRGPEILTDRQCKAMAALARYDRALGLDGCALVRQVLGNRMFMADVARVRGENGQHAVAYFGRRFRECLDTLAVAMGLAMGGR